MGVQDITVTVHSYSPLMGVHYIANTVHSDSPLTYAFLHFVQVTVILLWSLHASFLLVLHADFSFRSFDLGQNSHLFALVRDSFELVEGVVTAASDNIFEIPALRLFGRGMF